MLPLLPIPIVPEHIWKDVSEKDVKSFANEPKDGEPVVGSGPFRFVEGTAGGSTYRFEANPDYWKGAPHIDEVVFRVYKSEDPMVQALIKGEVDFVEDISALQVQSLEGKEGITAHNGDSPGFDEIAFNTGSIDIETGEPMGDPNPAVLDPEFRFALNFAVDREQIIRTVYQGAGQPGATIIPPAYSGYQWVPDGGRCLRLRPRARRPSCSTRPATPSATTASARCPPASPSASCGSRRAATRESSLDVMEFFQEWLADIDIDSEVETYESSKLTDVILEGNFDTFEWGWYVEPDPDSMLSYLTCGQLGNWSDSWYCNEEYDALYEQQHVEMDDAARQEIVRQMQEILYRDAPYLVTAYSSIGEAFRSDRWACFQPQPDPGGIWLIQYGVQNYLNVRPAADAGDCDGLENAVGASTGNGENQRLVRQRRRRRSQHRRDDRHRRGRRRRGRGGRLRADAPTDDRGRPRVSVLVGSELADVAASSEERGLGRKGPWLRPLRPRQVPGGAGEPGLHDGGQLLPVPGDAGRPGPDAGARPVHHPRAARGVQAHLRARPAVAAAVRDVREEHVVR